MPKCNVNFPTEICGSLERLESRTDDVCFEALIVGAEIAEAAVREKLNAVISSNPNSQSTGELQGSLGTTKPSVYGDSCNIKVGFNEPRRVQRAAKGKRSYKESTNAMIANVLEYGKSNQPPRPFLKPAQRACKDKVVQAMRDVFDKELKV